MYDSSIIAYDLSRSPNFEQTKRMLDQAFSKYNKLEGLIFHSDQGWQYQHQYYINVLKQKGIKQSFSRKGNCMDNSLMENFFGILKNEMFYGHEKEFKTLDNLQVAIEEYIKWYNEKRIYFGKLHNCKHWLFIYNYILNKISLCYNYRVEKQNKI